MHSRPTCRTCTSLNLANHYFRRGYTDAVRAVEAVRAVADVDPAGVAVTGGSQEEASPLQRPDWSLTCWA
jgi:cephalosporin-C deacetylase-like acetyl esterase